MELSIFNPYGYMDKKIHRQFVDTELHLLTYTQEEEKKNIYLNVAYAIYLILYMQQNIYCNLDIKELIEIIS